MSQITNQHIKSEQSYNNFNVHGQKDVINSKTYEKEIESRVERLERFSQERSFAMRAMEKRLEALELFFQDDSFMRGMESRIQKLELFSQENFSARRSSVQKDHKEKEYTMTKHVESSMAIEIPQRVQNAFLEKEHSRSGCLGATRITTAPCRQFIFTDKNITLSITLDSEVNRNEILFLDWEALRHSSRLETVRKVRDTCGHVFDGVISREPKMEKHELVPFDHSVGVRSKHKRDRQEKDYKLKGIISVSQKTDVLARHMYDIAVECMQDLAKDCAMREKITPDTLHLLNSGLYYGNEYLEILLDLQKKALSEKSKKAVDAQLKTFTEHGFFFSGVAPEKYFKFVKDKRSPTGKATTQYLIKNKTISASDALDAVIIRKELTFLDCTSVCNLSYYAALKNVLGKDKFDFLLASDGVTPLLIGIDRPECPLIYLLDFNQKDVVKGVLVKFTGPSFYKLKHINGEAQNFCTLVLDPHNKKYIGFGLDPEGETFKDIEKDFLREYNADPVGMKGLTHEAAKKLEGNFDPLVLSQVNQKKNDHMTMRQFRKNGKVGMEVMRGLDMEKIQQLIHSPKEKGRMLMAQWKLECLSIYIERQ